MGFTDEIFKHFLSYVEIGDYAVLQRSDCLNRAGGSANHILGFFSNRQYFLDSSYIFLNCYYGRLIGDYPLAPNVHKGIGGPEINCQIIRKPSQNCIEYHILQPPTRIIRPKLIKCCEREIKGSQPLSSTEF